MNKEQREILEKRLRKIKWDKLIPYVLILSGAFFCLSIIGAIIGVPLIVTGSLWIEKINKEQDQIRFKLAGGRK